MVERTYKIEFKCMNCGSIYETTVPKGIPAQGQGGECPNCGIKDGKAGVGNFLVIKANSDIPRNYN